MRRILSFILLVMMLAQSAVIVSGEQADKTTRFYVSTNGSDEGDGSEANPFATIERAQQAAREITAGTMEGNVEVILRGGIYELEAPLQFTRADSGNNGFEVIYKGYGDEYPLISGGRRVTGFEPAENGMWKTVAPEFETMRELYVNGKRVYRASTEQEVYAEGYWVNPDTGYDVDGLYFDKRILSASEKNTDVEIWWGTSWRSHIIGMEEITEDPANPNRVIAKGKQPFFMLTVHKGDVSAMWLARPSAACRIVNAFELLDQPGEYYFDKNTKELFYLPKEGEDMRTAEVYAPVLERLMFINSEGSEDGSVLAEHIRFEGLRFAHTTYLNVEKYGSHSVMQGTETYICDSRANQEDWAAIEVNHAGNIHFSKCVVFGTGAGGIRYHNTVYDSSVTGCAFYDIGGSAVVVGSNWHISQKYEESPTKPERVDMYEHSTWEVSDGGFYGEWPSIANYYSNGVHPMNDKKAGIKSWFKMEFDIPVSIDEIYYGYYDSSGNPEEIIKDKEIKHNFEILATNDPEYQDLTLLYRQGDEPAYGPGVTITPADTTTKFKYLLIRATEVQEFGFKTLHVWTKDYPWIMNETPRRIKIDNNYVTRTGLDIWGSPGITSYYTHDLSISHNEIDTTSWSGISAGWGWEAPIDNPCTRTTINNNLVKNFCVECHDGGGLYTLSSSKDGQIKGNYFKNSRGLYASFYPDMGTAFYHVDNNVCEDGQNAFFLWIGNITDNLITNMYANNDHYRDIGTRNTYEPIKTFIAGNPSVEAKAIMDAAGQQAEYKDIQRFVVENEPFYGKSLRDDYSSFYDVELGSEWEAAFIKTAETVFELAEYGTLPGQYSGQQKLILAERLADMESEDRVNDNESYGSLERCLRLQRALKDFEGSLVRYSLADTIQVAQEQLQNTKASKAEKEKLFVIIEEAKAADEDDYAMLKKLEAGIMAFDNALHKTEVLGFRLEGVDAVPVINAEEKTIELTVEETVDLSAIKASVAVSNGASVYPDLSKPLNFNRPVQIAVSNNGKAVAWTVSVKKSSSVSSDQKNTALWWNWVGNKVSLTGDSTLSLEKSETPHMFLGAPTNAVDLKISADKLENYFGTKVVFLSEKGELMPDAKADVHSYFELTIKKNALELSRFENGKQQIIYGSDADPEKQMTSYIVNADGLDAKSMALSIKTTVEGDKVRVVVMVNGEALMNVLCDVNKPLDKGYYGIHSVASDISLEV